MKDLLAPLLVTLAIELAVAICWGLRRKDLALCALVNLLTNPLVNLLHLLFPCLWLVLGMECAVVWAEGTLYCKLGDRVKAPFALSLVANAASFFLGSFLLFINIFVLRW